MTLDVVHASCLAYPGAGRGADIQVVDPPYASKVHANATSAGTGGRGVRKRDLGFASCSAALMLRLAEYGAQVQRWSLVFSDKESTHLWRAAFALTGCEYVRTVPWVRWSQPQLSGDRPPSGCEEVLVFHAPRAKGVRMHWNGPGNRIAYRAKSLRGADKHPTEKPLDLMLALVSDFSDPGELVFDPCAGRATTGVAAMLLGRDAVCLERDARWANAVRGDLSIGRDQERVSRWLRVTEKDARRVPVPKNESQQKTWERAQRRLADVERVKESIKA